MSKSDTAITNFGFKMGPCEVVRIANADDWGAYIEVKGKRQRIEIRVTPSGLLRVGNVINRKEPQHRQARPHRSEPCTKGSKKMSTKMAGSELIAAERLRQIKSERWSARHDDGHNNGELVRAAICYALPNEVRVYKTGAYVSVSLRHHLWPWEPKWWKPDADRVRELVKAGALIAAEIDRLQRKGRP